MSVTGYWRSTSWYYGGLVPRHTVNHTVSSVDIRSTVRPSSLLVSSSLSPRRERPPFTGPWRELICRETGLDSVFSLNRCYLDLFTRKKEQPLERVYNKIMIPSSPLTLIVGYSIQELTELWIYPYHQDSIHSYSIHSRFLDRLTNLLITHESHTIKGI